VECTVEGSAVRIGLGYITGLREDEALALVAERERGGPFTDLADLASRAGVGPDGLERLAWAGACERIGGGRELRRRQDLWQLGVASGARRVPGRGAANGSRFAGSISNDSGHALAAGDPGSHDSAEAPIQLSLPLPIPAPPTLRELDSWERLLADYSSTGIAIAEHPMTLVRPGLEDGMTTSADLDRLAAGSFVRVPGMVVARQRPATANGVVFMLLEDEVGTVNIVVPPPVYARHRMAIRTASFARVDGRLERRERVINVVARAVHPLATPDQPASKVRHIEPPVERETGRHGRDRAVAADPRTAELAAVAPAAHSFGRRGR
jgi:error-prone DNA polymerase